MRKIIVVLISVAFITACNSVSAPPEIVSITTAADPSPSLVPISISPPDTVTIENHQEFGKGTISQIAWSPDGKLIVVVGSAGIRFYDAETLQELRYIPAPFLITSIAFSPDGKYIATGSADLVFSRRTYWRRFSPWGSENNYIQLWDAESGSLLATLEGGNSYITTVVFSPDGALIVSGSNYSDDNAIRIWELASVIEGGIMPWKVYRDHTRGVYGLAFSPDGTTLLSGSGDNSARLWEPFSEQNNRILMYHSAAKVKVFAVSYSPVIAAGGMELVALAGADFLHNTPTELLEIWDVNSGELISELSGHTSSLDSVAFSPDGEILASGGSYPDNTIHLWDVARGEILRSLHGHNSGVRNLVFSPDGETLASSGWDGLLHLWDVETGELKLTNDEHTSVVHSAAFDPEKRILATGGDEGFIRLWNAETGAKLRVLNTESSRVTSLAFWEDTPYLIAGTDEPDFAIQIWDVETGERTHVLTGQLNFAQVIAIAPDGNAFASGGALGDNTLRIWDQDGKLLFAIDGFTRSVKSIAFNESGDLIASGDGKGTLRLIDADTGDVQLMIDAHTCAVTALSFDPRTDRLFSGDCNANIRFWDSENGSLLGEFQTKNTKITQISFSDEMAEWMIAFDDSSLWILDPTSVETTIKIEDILGQFLSLELDGRQAIIVSENEGGKTGLLELDLGTLHE